MVTRRRRRRGQWGFTVFCLIVSVAILAFGVYFMRVQQSGVPARATVQECDSSRGTRMSDQVFSFAFGDGCSGPEDSRGNFLEFWGVYRKDVGKQIDVHISRGTGVFDEAVPDNWMVPRIAVGVGAVLTVLTVIGIVVAIVRRLRPDPRGAQWAGQPWPGIQY